MSTFVEIIFVDWPLFHELNDLVSLMNSTNQLSFKGKHECLFEFLTCTIKKAVQQSWKAIQCMCIVLLSLFILFPHWKFVKVVSKTVMSVIRIYLWMQKHIWYFLPSAPIIHMEFVCKAPTCERDDSVDSEFNWHI